MSANILSAGFATTIQDMGRPGYYHLGIPMGGAMDRFALRCANLLVGNSEDAAGLECVFTGPEIEFTSDTVIAVTGANLPPKRDGKVMKTWTAIPFKAGQILSFDFLKAGARAYVAIAGGIDTPPILDSRSTYGIGALGGIEGRAVQTGDALPIGTATLPVHLDTRSIPATMRRSVKTPTALRVVPGLYWHRLTDESGDQFFQDRWKVASEADRMGYRFGGGSPLTFVEREPPFGAGSEPSNITDACYPYGSIQVPGGTEPIILHRDAVSGGGYCMVGTVISADMDLIGQLVPGDEVNFVKVNMHTALKARRSRAEMLDTVRRHLNG